MTPAYPELNELAGMLMVRRVPADCWGAAVDGVQVAAVVPEAAAVVQEAMVLSVVHTLEESTGVTVMRLQMMETEA